VTDFPEWAAFAGMASNPGFTVEERLGHALRAIELLEEVLGATRAQTVKVVTDVSEEAPEGWKNLVAGLVLMSKGATGPSPTHCEHDEMWVMADPGKFTKDEIAKLDELGFFEDEDAFKSFEFGSA